MRGSAYPVGVCRRLQSTLLKACLILDVAEGQCRQRAAEGGRAQACDVCGEGGGVDSSTLVCTSALAVGAAQSGSCCDV